MFWTLQRKAFPAMHKRGDEPTNRIIRSLLPGLSFLIKPSPEPPSSGPIVKTTAELSLQQLLNEDGIKEVYEAMASDAMLRAGEQHFGMRFLLIDQDRLVGVPEGLQGPSLVLPNAADVETGYPRACAMLRNAVNDLAAHSEGVGFYQDSMAGPARDELMLLMAIRPHRMAVEQKLGVHLAYQWPGIAAAAPKASEKRLWRFRSAAEQILAIHKISS